MVLRGFEIREMGAPGGSLFAVARLIMAFEAVGGNELLGIGDVDSLPCSNGRNCPNPDENPLATGKGVTGSMPLSFRCISRRDF